MRARSGGSCEKCGLSDGQQIHHRKPRGMGGTRDAAINSPANLLHVCQLCHSVIEYNRTRAYSNGWLVHSYAEPADVPVFYRGARKLLDNEGRAIRCALVQGR